VSEQAFMAAFRGASAALLQRLDAFVSPVYIPCERNARAEGLILTNFLRISGP